MNCCKRCFTESTGKILVKFTHRFIKVASLMSHSHMVHIFIKLNDNIEIHARKKYKERIKILLKNPSVTLVNLSLCINITGRSHCLLYNV